LTILPRRSRLLLPQRISGADGDAALLPFGDPEGSEPIPLTTIRPGEAQWTVTRDLVRYASRLEVVKDEGTFRLEDIDLDVTRRAYERYSWTGNDVLSDRGETRATMGFTRGGWHAWAPTRTVLPCTGTEFQIRASIEAYDR